MGDLVSYYGQCRILGNNSSLELIACVYCGCKIDEAGGPKLRFSQPSKIQLSDSIMLPSVSIMSNNIPFDINIQLIGVALAVTGVVAVLISRTHAARRILDVTCNVRQCIRCFLAQNWLINCLSGSLISHISHPQPRRWDQHQRPSVHFLGRANDGEVSVRKGEII